MFPAPPEVDRWIYGSFDADFYFEVERFPAPREVDWCLYDYLLDRTDNPAIAFPAPLEVNRCLYITEEIKNNDVAYVSGPSRGR